MNSDILSKTVKTCGCGCGAPVARKFLPGHDAKLKGRLLLAARTGRRDHAEAAAWQLIDMGWGTKLEADILHNLVARNGRRQVRQHLAQVGRFLVDAEGSHHANAACRNLTACAKRHGQVHPITKLARPSFCTLVTNTPEVTVAVGAGWDQCHECTVDETPLVMVQRNEVRKQEAMFEWVQVMAVAAEVVVQEAAAAKALAWS